MQNKIGRNEDHGSPSWVVSQYQDHQPLVASDIGTMQFTNHQTKPCVFFVLLFELACQALMANLRYPADCNMLAAWCVCVYDIHTHPMKITQLTKTKLSKPICWSFLRVFIPETIELPWGKDSNERMLYLGSWSYFWYLHNQKSLPHSSSYCHVY